MHLNKKGIKKMALILGGIVLAFFLGYLAWMGYAIWAMNNANM